jgi:hypothetical protein
MKFDCSSPKSRQFSKLSRLLTAMSTHSIPFEHSLDILLLTSQPIWHYIPKRDRQALVKFAKARHPITQINPLQQVLAIANDTEQPHSFIFSHFRRLDRCVQAYRSISIRTWSRGAAEVPLLRTQIEISAGSRNREPRSANTSLHFLTVWTLSSLPPS